MARILQQIEHIVVVMFENRSLDDMYRDRANPPSTFLPAVWRKAPHYSHAFSC